MTAHRLMSMRAAIRTATVPTPGSKPGLSERLAELHRLNQSSFLEIAETLSAEFNVKVSRNAVIGRAKRMHLPDRAVHAPCRLKVRRPRPRMSVTIRGAGPIRTVSPFA